jgi:cobalt/nickel transport system permease protein
MARLLAAVGLLILIALLPPGRLLAAPAALILAWTMAARAPVGRLLARAAIVLPFTLLFSALSWWTGDLTRAWSLPLKSFLSALAVVLLMETTPLERVLGAAARLGMPRLLVDVIGFTWRYFGVLRDEAARLRNAAMARGAERSFRISASSVALLLASSWNRSERIHRAMLARGMSGGPAA